jgi:hypothetical protein
VIDEEVAREVYEEFVKSKSVPIIATELGVDIHIVYRLRAGTMRRFADLYREYKSRIPRHPQIYKSGLCGGGRYPPFVTPHELAAIARRRPDLAMV